MGPDLRAVPTGLVAGPVSWLARGTARYRRGVGLGCSGRVALLARTDAPAANSGGTVLSWPVALSIACSPCPPGRTPRTEEPSAVSSGGRPLALQRAVSRRLAGRYWLRRRLDAWAHRNGDCVGRRSVVVGAGCVCAQGGTRRAQVRTGSTSAGALRLAGPAGLAARARRSGPVHARAMVLLVPAVAPAGALAGSPQPLLADGTEVCCPLGSHPTPVTSWRGCRPCHPAVARGRPGRRRGADMVDSWRDRWERETGAGWAVLSDGWSAGRSACARSAARRVARRCPAGSCLLGVARLWPPGPLARSRTGWWTARGSTGLSSGTRSRTPRRAVSRERPAGPAAPEGTAAGRAAGKQRELLANLERVDRLPDSIHRQVASVMRLQGNYPGVSGWCEGGCFAGRVGGAADGTASDELGRLVRRVRPVAAD